MWEFLMHKSLSFFFRIPSLFTDMWSPPLIFYFIRMICVFFGWFLLSAVFLVLPGAFLFSPDEFYSPRRICSPWITFVLPGFIWLVVSEWGWVLFSPDEFCCHRMNFVFTWWVLFSLNDFCFSRMSFVFTGWVLFSPDEFSFFTGWVLFSLDAFCSSWISFVLPV